MIKVTMGLGGVAGESTRFWFDQAVQAQFDDLAAYQDLSWALLPRWGGSHDEMMAFARECLETKRFDTGVPWQFHRVVALIASDCGEQMREAYAAPGVYDDYQVMFDGYLAAAKDENARLQLESQRACAAWLAGHDDEARRRLDALGANVVSDALSKFEVTLAEMRFALSGVERAEIAQLNFEPGVFRMAFAPAVQRFMVLGPGTGATLWDTSQACQRVTGPTATRHAEGIRDADLAADGRTIALISMHHKNQFGTGSIELWDVATEKMRISCDSKGQLANCLRLSPDSKLLVAGVSTGELMLYDAETGQAYDQVHLTGRPSLAYALAFSADGKRLACATIDRYTTVWDVPGDLEAVDGPVTAAAVVGPLPGIPWSLSFSPDGKRLLIGYEETELWDIETMKMVFRVGGKFGGFAPDGSRIVTAGGSLKNEARVWNAANGAELGRLVGGHLHAISAASFSPSGRRIVTGTMDFDRYTSGVVRCWDAETLEEVPAFSGLQ